MNNLYIFGGTSLKRVNNDFYIKKTHHNYLSKFEKHFDKIYWIVPITNNINVKTKVNFKKIETKPYKKNIFDIIYINIFLVYKSLTSKNKFYVLFNNSPFILPALPFLRKRCKKFITYVGIDYEDIIKHKRLNNIYFWKKYYFFYLKYILVKSNLILARGRKIFNFCNKFNSNILLTYPIGWNVNKHIPFDQFKYNLYDLKKFEILYIGKIIKEKGIYNLLETFLKIQDNFKEIVFNLNILGDGSDLQKCKHLYKNHNINFHGWVDEEDKIIDCLSKCSILICPTLPGYPEGVPRVIDEAINFSKLVIASNVGGIKDEFTDGSILLFNSDNNHNLYLSIQKILKKDINLEKYYDSMQIRRLKQKNAADQHINLLLS